MIYSIFSEEENTKTFPHMSIRNNKKHFNIEKTHIIASDFDLEVN